MSFDSLGLSAHILEAVAAQGYTTPSPIQAQAIPAVLEGRDVMAAAQTGTGKTAGFTLPLLQRLSAGKPAGSNRVRALVLTPTRELAAQVHDSVETYGSRLPVKANVVFGGVKINPQMMKLRRGSDVLVATPGRLLDLHQQNAVAFDQLEILVLDEADRMLDMGFIRDIRKILALLPQKRQNLLFSATFSEEIRDLAKGLVTDPVEISVTPRNSTAKTVEQMVYPVDKSQKSKLLTQLIHDNQWQQVLVFTKTKHGANRLTKQLDGRGITAAAIHGNKSQGARTRALAEFKSGDIRVLVATDIAARGLDIDQLPQVVNFDLPNVSEDYVHRIGRTGRAGASGKAVSLVCAEEFKLLNDIERLIQKLLPRETLVGFEPGEPLPESRLLPPRKPKKPKKPKDSQNSQHSNKRGAAGNASGTGEKTQNQRRRSKPTGQKTRGSATTGVSDIKDSRPPRRRRPRRRPAANG
ncbi:DEAD/DEAH box helicase [Pseudomaricurvus alkylphenolicus]|uniref:DEAD/DEAH box helicase n=1 Tax=Pseudomaricurvus alkylphenolicus TaxID=1306991 RepID=UPI0014249AE1|nr:DEAD/DEAH box helicase [Pseudomaricurvus alkylphenolicus]NIB40742.1 DEAD/DEAH box helicase [Pseudomaricurvus alkylphenolicus]